MAFYDLHPFGEDRADVRMGISTSALVNCWASKRSKRTKPKDFIPDWGDSRHHQGQTVEEQIAIAKAMAGVKN